MIITRKLFSRHTPKGLEKYADLSDGRLDELSKGEKLALIDSEGSKAHRNHSRYITKKAVKYVPIAAAAGAGLGALAGGKGYRTLTAGYGALIGGVGGTVASLYRGDKFAKKEGHPGEESKLMSTARKVDSHAKLRGLDDDFTDRVKSKIATKRAQATANTAIVHSVLHTH